MKILCFTHFFLPELGGMQVSNTLLIEGLRESGEEVELHVLGRSDVFREDGLHSRFEHTFSATGLIGHLKVFWLVLSRTKKLSPDLVILLDAGVERAVAIAPRTVFNLKTKIISVNSGSIATRDNQHIRGKLHALLVRKGYKLFDRIFVADATAERLKELYPQLVPKIRCLGRPIPKEFFNEPKPDSNWPLEIDTPIFISAGRAESYKGIGLVLEALRQLKENNGTEVLEFWYVGDGPELENWKRMAERFGLSKVKFLGHINFNDLPKIYNMAHFFILPSQYENETFGRTWVEAMACSKPVISTSVNNLSKIVFDGKNGFLVEPNADSVKNAIDRSLGLSGEEYNALSTGAYQTACKYELSKVVDDLLQMI